MDIGLF